MYKSGLCMQIERLRITVVQWAKCQYNNPFKQSRNLNRLTNKINNPLKQETKHRIDVRLKGQDMTEY